jgi:hypothetical protein
MTYPDDATGEALRRMHAQHFDFSKPYPVDFYAVFRTEADADEVAQQYVADHQAGNRLLNVETRPAEPGGMELKVVKHMLVTHAGIAQFEQTLATRIAPYEAYLDGWGVLEA